MNLHDEKFTMPKISYQFRSHGFNIGLQQIDVLLLTTNDKVVIVDVVGAVWDSERDVPCITSHFQLLVVCR